MARKLALWAGVSIIALSISGVAGAQELDVTKRPRPEYDAVGIHAGSFLIYPHTKLSETYDNNIYATENNKKSSYITTLNPQIDIKSNWNNHALNFSGYVDNARYSSHNSENYTDYGASTNGRLDIRRSANLFGGASYDHLHEARGDPNSPANALYPVQYDETQANLGGLYKPNRLGITTEFTYAHLSYNNVDAVGGGTLIETDRNRNVYKERLRVGYDIQPGYTAFVQGTLNQRRYINRPDTSGYDRNSEGYNVNAGIAVSITSLINGEFFAGYLHQSYKDSHYSNTGSYDVGGRLLWSVTPLTTVKASLARSVEETIVVASSSYIDTTAILSVDHELRRNVLVGAGFTYANDDYQDVSRKDNVYQASAHAKYLINRRFFAGAKVGYTDRHSNTAGIPYKEFTAGAFLGIQF